ncbi:hypothetical protein EMCRGX_G026722 [Ephydatia muelleri]
MAAKKCSVNQLTQLPSLSRRCVYHALCILHGSYSTPGRQAALFGQITAFCSEIKRVCGCAGSDLILAPHDLHRFADGGVTVKQFCTMLEDALLRGSSGRPDLEALHEVCYRFYHDSTEMTEEGYVDIEMLPRDCRYRLWVIFNVLVGREDSILVDKDNFRDLLKRFFELSGLNWTNDPNELANKVCLTFLEYLKIIKGHFERQDLRMPLTCEMIEDVYDEFVCGVHMKGYLFKRGHVRKNFKRRWFILRRTKLIYFQSKDTLLKKGEIALDNGTEVEDIPDTKKLAYAFKLFCVASGKPFLMVADTQKDKHQWMKAIDKVLVLTKLAEQKGTVELYGQSLQHFYTLKYGSSSISPHVADPELKILDHYEGFSKDNHDSGGESQNTQQTITIPHTTSHTNTAKLATEQDDSTSATSFYDALDTPRLEPAAVQSTSGKEVPITEHNPKTLTNSLSFDEGDYAYPSPTAMSLVSR